MKITGFFYSLILLVLILGIACTGDSSEGIQIADSRRTDYNLIIPENPSVKEREAAERLQKSLLTVTRANFPILTDATPRTNKEIVLGESKRMSDSGIDFKQVNPSGYSIKTKGQKLYIYSPSEGEGVLNAVMDFSKSLGLERFIPNLSVYSIDTVLQIQPLDIVFNPPFEWRSLHNIGAEKEDFYQEHKLHNSPVEKSKWGLWGFELDKLVPQYYQQTEDGAKLQKSICLSAEGFYSEIKSGLARLFSIKKSASHWSVSFRENEMWCACADCKKVQDEEGSTAGPVINLINRLASDFPSKIWATTVYSDQQPTKTPVVDNVITIVSTKNINRSVSIADDEYSAVFRENLDGWLAMTDQILMFDYLTDPKQPLSPSINLKTIQSNLQYFSAKGIKMVHMEGTNATGSDMGPLKTYLAARLLWDPNINLDQNIQSFCELYFGEAGQYIKRYLDLQNEQSEKYGKMLTIEDGPTVSIKTHLRPELMDQYNYFFNQAEEVIKGDPELRDRVKLARLPMVFSSLEQAKVYGTGKKGFFLNINGRWMAVPGLKTLSTNFAAECDRMKVKYVLGNKTPTQYDQDVQGYASQNVGDHLAFDVAPVLRRPPAQDYSGGDVSILTDGLYGDESHLYGWVGYETFDMEATLSLPQNTAVNTLNIRFKNDPEHNIFLPKTVSVQVSQDGTNYKDLSRKSIGAKQNKTVETISFPLQGQSVKSLKIVGSNIKVVPSGYVSAGQPAWLFSDEIELN